MLRCGSRSANTDKSIAKDWVRFTPPIFRYSWLLFPSKSGRSSKLLENKYNNPEEVDLVPGVWRFYIVIFWKQAASMKPLFM
jgi:hypothetical protein